MGRNGKKPSVFTESIRFINEHVGEIVTANEILLGKKPGRGAETAYLYKFIKLGYVQQEPGKSVQDPTATYKILKAFPAGYNSQQMKLDLKELKPNII